MPSERLRRNSRHRRIRRWSIGLVVLAVTLMVLPALAPETVVADSDTSGVNIVSGTGTFAGVTSSNKHVTVSPGDRIYGDLTMTASNTWASSSVVILVGVPSWRPHESDYWTVNNVHPGPSSQGSGTIDITAPNAPGDYHLIFAMGEETSAAFVASVTDSQMGQPVWGDGNDVADFTAPQVSNAQLNGRASVQYLTATGYVTRLLPADAVTITVASHPLTKPGAPTDTFAMPSDTVVFLTWEPPLNDGGEPISAYHVYWGNETSNYTWNMTLDGTNLYAFIPGLRNGETYYFRVSARNSLGEGPMCQEMHAVPSTEDTVPSAPISLKATGAANRVILSWEGPAFLGGDPVTFYAIHRGISPNGEGSTPIAQVTGALTYEDSSADEPSEYYYTVSAFNVNGEGVNSTEASASPIMRPTQPSISHVEAAGGEVSIYWTRPSGGSDVSLYSVYRDYGTGREKVAEVPSFLLECHDPFPIVKDMSGSRQVTYYVVASNAAGASAPSQSSSVVVPVQWDWLTAILAVLALFGPMSFVITMTDRIRRMRREKKGQ